MLENFTHFTTLYRGGRMGKSYNKSKLFTTIAVVQFIVVLAYSMITLWMGSDPSALAYLIPSSGTVATIGLGFYFNKAKAENLSKQRIRYVYLKMLLENKLDAETYAEIEQELNNIDEIINNKLYYSLQETVNEDINSI